MRQIKANTDLKYKYDLPIKSNKQFKHNNGGPLVYIAVAIIIASFTISGLSLLYPVYHLFKGGFAISQLLLPVAVATPGAIAIGYLHSLNVRGAAQIDEHTDGRDKMLKLLKQPLINTEHNSVKFLYDFIDIERSTDHELVFYNNTDQDFVFADDVSLDATIAESVRQYSKLLERSRQSIDAEMEHLIFKNAK